MATLKSIKNKYLSASDGDALGVTTNTENVAALSFKLATADSLTKFNMVDGFSDDYNDATGVDASASTNENRNSSGKYFGGSASGLWLAPTGVSEVKVLIVAGGGGGGGGYAGGGGGGGIVYDADLPVTAGNSYTLLVGAGGLAATSGQPGGSGGNSQFGDTLIALGGGGGSGNDPAPSTPNQSDGGSGGGGYGYNNPQPGVSTQPSYPGATSYGGDGYAGSGNGPYAAGGGGGAANTGGGAGGGGGPGNGGYGQQFPDFGAYGTDSSNNANPPSGKGYFGGGGGGAGNPDYVGGSGGQGGRGGGGNGGKGGTASEPGRNGTGGGGGGSGYQPGGAGAYPMQPGGSGFVGLIYTPSGQPEATVGFTENPDAYLDMTLQSNAFTAQTAPTTARIILDENSAAGTTTLNTDIKAYASRDNGTTFTQMTLANQGFQYSNPGNDAYAKLMLHMDGADNGTTFTDSSMSNHTITRNSGTTQTAIKKFGTASCYQDGTGTDTVGQLSIANSSDWDFGTGEFTIDFWLYLFTLGSNLNQKIIGCSNYSSGWQGWHLKKNHSQMKLHWEGGANTTAFNTGSSGSITAETWTHVAVVKSGTTTKLYFDGVEQFSLAQNYAIQSTGSEAFQIGEGGADANWNLPKMYIDEVRVSKGVARWTSAFTPPVEPYATSRRLLSGSVDISGQPSGTNMKYKIETLNQAITKQTRVYGTSMAWA